MDYIMVFQGHRLYCVYGVTNWTCKILAVVEICNTPPPVIYPHPPAVTQPPLSGYTPHNHQTVRNDPLHGIEYASAPPRQRFPDRNTIRRIPSSLPPRYPTPVAHIGAPMSSPNDEPPLHPKWTATPTTAPATLSMNSSKLHMRI